MKIILLLLLFVTCNVLSQRNELKMDEAPFIHGVASGDPLEDRVIIWTRVTPDDGTSSVDVHWRIATDTSMYNIADQGVFTTDEFRDFTVKVDAANLAPSTCYYYDFRVDSSFSVRGRTRTADTGDNDLVRFALVSCSNYEHGYFNAYEKISDRNDLNAVIHLGDYIYEYETGGYSASISDRENYPSHEIVSLEDYRLRYSHYRLDNNLKNLHQQYPFICIWDDHESANDAYKDGAENHSEATEGIWETRKSSSRKAYFEWMPIRDNGPDSIIYRKFNYGNLLNLYMLDTRIEGRDKQVEASSSEVNDANRSLLGETQYNWLTSELSNSNAQWNIIGQQVMIAPLEAFGVPVNPDQWDGYNYERNQLLNHIMNNNIENVVVLTGDIHTSWANDIPLNNYNASTGENSVGVEFVTTSVTSPGLPIGVPSSMIQTFNPHNKWLDLTNHGYVILSVDKQKTQAEWYFLDDIETEVTNESLANAFYVNDGERFLRQSTLATVGYINCDKAPEYPYDINDFLSLEENAANKNRGSVLMGVYPNPHQDELTIHLGANQSEMVSLRMIDNIGKVVYKNDDIIVNSPSTFIELNTIGLASGTYLLKVITDNKVMTRKVVKR
jgi:alkaline phosphatase D